VIVRSRSLISLVLRSGPGDHPVDGLGQMRLADLGGAFAGGQQRSLVEQVGEVRPGEPRGLAGQHLEVDVVFERLALGVDLEDLVAADQVGAVDHDLAIEASRPEQRRVEDVGSVGRGDHDDRGAHVEAVHLDQKLVERLLPLVVAAAHPRAAMATDRVDLVDEDDRRCAGLGLLEEVADPAGAHTDEHLDEVAPRDREERHAGLAGHRPREQRLAGPRRAEQQHALGDLGADRLELLRVLEELLDLAQLLDRGVGPGHVVEGDLRRVLGDLLGLGLAELHDPAAGPALHVLHQQEEHEQDQDERQDRHQHRGQRPGLLGVEPDRADQSPVEPGAQLRAVDLGAVGGAEGDGRSAVTHLAFDRVRPVADGGDLEVLTLQPAGLDRFLELRPGQLTRRGGGLHEADPEPQRGHERKDPRQRALEEALALLHGATACGKEESDAEARRGYHRARRPSPAICAAGQQGVGAGPSRCRSPRPGDPQASYACWRRLTTWGRPR
jgi:hypothetical protein